MHSSKAKYAQQLELSIYMLKRALLTEELSVDQTDKALDRLNEMNKKLRKLS